MNKGVSLYLAVLVLIALLAMVLGVATIIFTQIKIIREMGYSAVAFHSADSGIEYVLDLGSSATTSESPYSGSLSDDFATWTASVINPGDENCPSDTANFCINSRGSYQGIQRAIQITR